MQMHDSGETAMKNVLRDKAMKFFGPEMIGRFERWTGVVVFNRLSPEIQNLVCDSMIKREITLFCGGTRRQHSSMCREMRSRNLRTRATETRWEPGRWRARCNGS